MEESDFLVWSLEDHMSAGGRAVEEVALDPAGVVATPVCHHFQEFVFPKPRLPDASGNCAVLVEYCSEQDIEFLEDRLEAWEIVIPDVQWLEARVPEVLNAAKQSGLQYLGWTWEPRHRSPISASSIYVIDNRTTIPLE